MLFHISIEMTRRNITDFNLKIQQNTLIIKHIQKSFGKHLSMLLTLFGFIVLIVKNKNLHIEK